MDQDNKNLLKYLGLIFLAVLLTYKLPHDSYTISQYIIPPIRSRNNSVIYLSGLVPLILLMISLNGLFKLERFQNKRKFLVFIAIIGIVIPFMRWTLDFSRTNYHWMKDDGVKAIDIEQSSISLSDSNGKTTMMVNIELKDYSRKQHKFNIRMYLPENLKSYTDQDFYEFETDYSTYGYRSTLNIDQEVSLEFDSRRAEELFENHWYFENTGDVEYELYNEEGAVNILQHGL